MLENIIHFKHVSNTHLSQNNSLFPYLGLGLVLRLWLWLVLQLRFNPPLIRNCRKSFHATTLVSYNFYFYVIHKYYHTHENGGVLDNTYYSQVLHTSKDRVVFGTPIQVS